MRIRKKTIQYLVVGCLLFVVIVALRYFAANEVYGVDASGVLHAPQNIDLQATRTIVETNENYALYKTTYESQGATIVGNLYVPTKKTGRGMLLLPGGGVTKEGEALAARAFSVRGFIVLTIDQRGVGETGGQFNSLENDYQAFLRGQIPTQHLLILDALAGIQYLEQQSEVQGKVLLAGESMGARAAIVAARISGNINGLLVISSSGFGDPSLPPAQKRFMNSFNPDMSINQVRVPILFLHSNNDTTIPVAYARNTFDRAPERKKFLTVDHCAHGYCDAMALVLDEGLRWMALAE